MDRLMAMMISCEALFDGTLASPAAAGHGASTELDAAVKKWPMEKLEATMAFCKAPLDGTFDCTLAPSSLAATGYGSSATRGGGVVATAKKWPVERLVATMAFCEAPFDGIFDGTSAPSSTSGATGGSSASPTNVHGDADGGGDRAALRRAWLAGGKEWPVREHRLPLREKARTVVNGLAIFETVALE